MAVHIAVSHISCHTKLPLCYFVFEVYSQNTKQQQQHLILLF